MSRVMHAHVTVRCHIRPDSRSGMLSFYKLMLQDPTCCIMSHELVVVYALMDSGMRFFCHSTSMVEKVIFAMSLPKTDCMQKCACCCAYSPCNRGYRSRRVSV